MGAQIWICIQKLSNLVKSGVIQVVTKDKTDEPNCSNSSSFHPKAVGINSNSQMEDNEVEVVSNGTTNLDNNGVVESIVDMPSIEIVN